MPIFERITVTLPNGLVRDVDRQAKNRSKFVTEAGRRELDHRRRQELRRSLQNPHSESKELSESGLEAWSLGLPEEDAGALSDGNAGKAIRSTACEGR